MYTSRAIVAALAFAVALPVTAAAQTHALDRGSFLVGGGASFTRNGGEVDGESLDPSTEWSLSPRLMYFVLPGLALGGEASLSRDKSGGATFTTYGAGPAVAYYFGASRARPRPWYPYIEGGVRLLRTRSNRDITGLEESLTGFHVAGGILLMLSDAVGLDGELFYDVNDQEIGLVEVRTNVLGFAIGFSAFLF